MIIIEFFVLTRKDKGKFKIWASPKNLVDSLIKQLGIKFFFQVRVGRITFEKIEKFQKTVKKN